MFHSSRLSRVVPVIGESTVRDRRFTLGRQARRRAVFGGAAADYGRVWLPLEQLAMLLVRVLPDRGLRRLLGVLLARVLTVPDAQRNEWRRAVYSTLGAVGGDESVSDLEAELLQGNWFARGQEAHRQAIARVLARIGSEAARMVLQRGALSKRGPVRKACEDAMSGWSTS